MMKRSQRALMERLIQLIAAGLFGSLKQLRRFLGWWVFVPESFNTRKTSPKSIFPQIPIFRQTQDNLLCASEPAYSRRDVVLTATSP